MIAAYSAPSTGGPSRDDEGAAAALGLAEWLRWAATPTFAGLALVSGLSESPMETFCSAGHGAPLSGMATMYLLMSAFHSPPWLNLICRRFAPQNPYQATKQPSRDGGSAIAQPTRLQTPV